MIRLTHGAVAFGFGAADALVTSRLTKLGPGGIPFSVYLEAAGVVAGVWGDKVGLNADVRDPLLLSALGLAGARLTRATLSNKLMAGPRAWGGDYLSAGGDGDYSMLAAGGSPALVAAPGRVRLLPGRAVGGSIGIYPAQQEMAGIAG